MAAEIVIEMRGVVHRNPFWYQKADPEQSLCAKCFAEEKASPMGELYQASGFWRECLVCDKTYQIQRGRYNPVFSLPRGIKQRLTESHNAARHLSY